MDICDNDNAILNLQKEYPEKDVLFVKTDVADNSNVKRSFEQAKDKFGHFDIVIGNAGIADESRPEKTIQINLVSII